MTKLPDIPWRSLDVDVWDRIRWHTSANGNYAHRAAVEAYQRAAEARIAELEKRQPKSEPTPELEAANATLTERVVALHRLARFNVGKVQLRKSDKVKRLRAESEEAQRLLQEVSNEMSDPIGDDLRLSYVTVQLSRETFEDVRKAAQKSKEGGQ